MLAALAPFVVVLFALGTGRSLSRAGERGAWLAEVALLAVEVGDIYAVVSVEVCPSVVVICRTFARDAQIRFERGAI